MLNKGSVIVKAKSTIESEIDGEVVLMNMDNNEYYSMDAVGSAIWRFLEQPRSVNDIVEQLLEKYEVSREQCEKDTLGFLNQLYEKGIISLDE